MKESKALRYDTADAYRKAKWAISRDGNRLTLISAFGGLILFCMLYYFLYTALLGLSAVLMVDSILQERLLLAAYLPLAFLLTVFVFLPLLVGVLLLAYDMVEGEDASLSMIFRPFSEGALYRRVLRLSLGATLRLGSVGLLIWATYALTVYFFSGSLLAGFLCAIVIIAELLIGLRLSVKTYAALFFAAKDTRMPSRTARRMAKQLDRTLRVSALRFYAYFLPHILLGLVTLGIYLLAQTLPMMALTYFCDCDERVRLAAAQPKDDLKLEDTERHE